MVDGFDEKLSLLPEIVQSSKKISPLVAAQNSDDVTRKLDSIPAESRNSVFHLITVSQNIESQIFFIHFEHRCRHVQAVLQKLIN